MNKYNVWNKWDPLEVVMLGNLPDSSQFDFINDKKVRDPLKQLIDESNEDLAHYEEVLKEWGAKVIRPEKVDHDFYEVQAERVKAGLRSHMPRPLIMPRDHYAVLGENLFVFNDREKMTRPLMEYNDKDVVYMRGAEDTILTQTTFHAPQVTIVGKDIYLDMQSDRLIELQERMDLEDGDLTDAIVELMEDYEKQVEILRENIPDCRIIELNIGGHNDGTFHTIGEGKIITLQDIQKYDETFPYWSVNNIQQLNVNPDVNSMFGWKDAARKTNSKWFVPGAMDNDGFVEYINTWFGKWVGQVSESFFDVNVLMLDDRTMCVNNVDNPTIREVAKKHKLELVHVPWKHRFFWDGGLHCLTLDLKRDGVREDYFPDREGGMRDLGYDVNDPYSLLRTARENSNYEERKEASEQWIGSKTPN